MAKNQAQFDRLIYCINISENGLIPHEHEAKSSDNLPFDLTPDESYSFPIVWKNQRDGIETLDFWLDDRGLTDDDVEKLIYSLIRKPLLAVKIQQLKLSNNNLTRIPAISKSDFPNISPCSISGNPIILNNKLTELMFNLRIGRDVNISKFFRGPTHDRAHVFNILNQYHTYQLNESLIGAYRNAVILSSQNLLGNILPNEINMRINSFLTPALDFELDINNLEESVREKFARENNYETLLALVQAYKTEMLPTLVKKYNKKLLNAESNPKVKALCNLNSFLNKNSFNANSLDLKNTRGYTPRYLAAENMVLKKLGLRKNDEHNYYAISKALYYRRKLV